MGKALDKTAPAAVGIQTRRRPPGSSPAFGGQPGPQASGRCDPTTDGAPCRAGRPGQGVDGLARKFVKGQDRQEKTERHAPHREQGVRQDGECLTKTLHIMAAVPLNLDGFMSVEQISAVKSVLDQAVSLAADGAENFKGLFFLGNGGQRR